MKNISSIDFHDTKILRVIEDCSADLLKMEVSYPIDWDNNVFEPRDLIFENTYNYQVFEIPFEGSPTILDVNVSPVDNRWSKICLKTNAGHREIICESVKLDTK